MSMSRSLSRAGGSPGSTNTRIAGALRGSAALLVSLMLGACSTSNAMMQTADWYPLQPPGATAVAPPAFSGVPLVEIEGDGLAGQTPPRHRPSEVPDDPSEPYSPNYGSAPAAAEAVTPHQPA